MEAWPPSTRYKLRKFAGKHRKALTAAGLVIVLLSAAVVVSAWEAIQARRASDTAQHALVLAEARFDMAKEAVDNFLNNVTELPELKNGNFEALRTKLLESAIPLYTKLTEDSPGDAEREAVPGLAYERLGQIHLDLMHFDQTLANYKAMQGILPSWLKKRRNTPCTARH